MKSKLQLAILCGGQSTEHEISLRSARSIIPNLNADKYAVIVVFIDHAGCWWLVEDVQAFLKTDTQNFKKNPLTIRFGDRKKPFQYQDDSTKTIAVDCIFPVLHGTFGEDGTMQGLLELMQVPFVGGDALSCAVSMNKAVTKELLVAHNLPVVPWVEIHQQDINKYSYQMVSEKLGEVLFVKPVHLGSSVGTHKVNSAQKWAVAIEDAFRYDNSVLVESAIVGRELECAVLGNDKPTATLPAEIIPTHEFYSYEAKYLDPNGAKIVVPADLDENIAREMREQSIAAFKAVRCCSMLRVDFFLENNGTLYINELNPIPGFTSISLYPKMWQATGLAYAELLDELIKLALERFQAQLGFERNYHPDVLHAKQSTKSESA